MFGFRLKCVLAPSDCTFDSPGAPPEVFRYDKLLAYVIKTIRNYLTNHLGPTLGSSVHLKALLPQLPTLPCARHLTACVPILTSDLN